MTWYKLEDDQVDGIINLLYLLIGGCALASFYVNNPIWIISVLVTILVCITYHSFLYNKHKHKVIEIQVREKVTKEFQEKIREYELELERLKKE